MLQIVLIGKETDSLSELKAVFEEFDANVIMMGSCDEALSQSGQSRVDLVVADEQVTDMSGLDCIRKMIAANPMLNFAAVSSLSHEMFHEASEGLGVLMQLPVSPDKKKVEELLARLGHILQLTRKAER